MSRLLPAVWFLVSLLLCAEARATSMVIWRPTRPSPELKEALFRLQGELLAVGLEVRVVERPGSARPGDSGEHIAMQAVAQRERVDAIIDAVGDDATMSVNIWTFRNAAPSSEVSRVTVDKAQEDGAKTLAIRAMEVLRSRFVELDLGSPPVAPPPPAPEERRAPPLVPARARTELVGVQLGGALVASLDGVGPAVLPLVGVDFAPRSWLVVQATVAGLGSRPTVRTEVGSARIRQDYGLLGLCYCSPSEPGIRPLVALAAGALRTALVGRASPPAEGHSLERWSFLVDASLGASLRLPSRFYLTLASHVQLAEPYLSVHFVDSTVATLGRPNVLLTLTAGAWL